MGDISLEGLGEDSSININYDTGSHELVITGKCQFRFSSLMDDIVDVTRRNLRANSIYKGQALEILKINKNEKTLGAFIKMMESAHGEDITDYEN